MKPVFGHFFDSRVRIPLHVVSGVNLHNNLKNKKIHPFSTKSWCVFETRLVVFPDHVPLSLVWVVVESVQDNRLAFDP